MYFTTILALAPFLAGTIAWKIPEGLPDGSYTVSLLANGTYIHEKVADVPKAVLGGRRVGNFSSIRGEKTPLANEVSCSPNRLELNHDWTDAANSGVDSQCAGGRNVVGHMSIYTKVGDVVAYFCSNSGRNNCVCFPQDRQKASTLITAACGWYVFGWSYETGAHCTYGYAPVNHNFCPQ